MTAEKSIKIIEVAKAECEWNAPLDYQEAFNMAIEALERQIPKKVRITTSTKRCAVCGRQLSGIGNMHPTRLYCQKCGQAIDWE